ncbi:serine hydrolase domain-containing protein [Phenylobacterium sp.]|jgi:CubicO group peptidase (beta-lactamase class C family)|uniref:serine hydrolase domain-containing protein n=1 Tax=Phenylobacterium sp. TaxID=1871053 RepID=UPI002F92EEB4
MAGGAGEDALGHVSPGFEPVAEAFAAQLLAQGALGAACTIYLRGEKVVDLWGGWKTRERREPWTEDTMVLGYSLTKGVTGLTCAVAASQGLFSYDEPVIDIWPEFGAHGKHTVTVGQLLSEQAGVAAIDIRLTPANMGRQDLMASAIARQRPNWRPGEWAGNHSYTLGWLASELIRRRDPSRRSLGAFFREELAAPLAAEFYIGLPPEIPRERLARVDGFGLADLVTRHANMPWRLVVDLYLPWSLSFRALNNPLLLKGPAELDAERWRGMELGAIGGIGTARALAALYNAFACPTDALPLDPAVLALLAEGFAAPRCGRLDQVIKDELVYSLCFEKPGEGWRFGTPAAYGSFAVGGSFAFADPADGVAYAWMTNSLGLYKRDDPRELAVRRAFYRCIRRT